MLVIIAKHILQYIMKNVFHNVNTKHEITTISFYISVKLHPNESIGQTNCILH